MNFNEYQTQALKTAQYPHEYKVLYPLLKLGGEIGEVSEKVGKTLRDHDGDFSTKKHDIALEIGDVLWYIAALSHDIGISLEFPKDVTTEGDEVFTTLNLQRLQGKLVARIFESWEDSVYPKAITRILKEILLSAGELAYLLGYSYLDIVNLNLEKLSSRKQRGVIGGSGDHR